MTTASSYTVIGASGFIGRRLASNLRDAGHSVYAPARDDLSLFSRELGHVFYCAGLTADYVTRPFDTIDAHVSFLARILREARFTSLVYLSSTRLYDSLGDVRCTEDISLSLNPINPRHIYDFSKGLGESLCLTVAADRTAIARLSCVFDWRTQAPGFLSEWLQRATREKKFTLDSGTGFVRDYIQVDDVVSALRAIADQGANGIINVASGENMSNAELAEVFNRFGWSVSLSRDTPRQAAPVCDIQRLASLGVRQLPVRAVIENCLRMKEFNEAT